MVETHAFQFLGSAREGLTASDVLYIGEHRQGTLLTVAGISTLRLPSAYKLGCTILAEAECIYGILVGCERKGYALATYDAFSLSVENLKNSMAGESPVGDVAHGGGDTHLVASAEKTR